ncbi:MAG: tol-pal system-associated acyl-CoA thioesterase [Pseudomonadota bacterium]
MKPHLFPCKVYYEDTDLQGIVYYANYFKFIERGRTEALSAIGIDQMALMQLHGVMFVVRRVEADYHKPARFGDDLDVRTEISSVGAASLNMQQEVLRDQLLLFSASIRIAVVNQQGKAERMPQSLHNQLVGS